MLRWLKFSVVALVGCGFIGMIGYALWMRDAIRSAQLEPPLISAPDSPVKRRPESPGGMEIPNRDKLVFDLLDNSASVTAPAPAPVEETADNSGADNAAPAVTAETASTTTGQPVANVAARVTAKDSEAANPVADQLALARLASEGANETPMAVSPAAGAPVKVAAKVAVSPTATVKLAPKAVATVKPVTAVSGSATAAMVAAAGNAPSKGFGVQVGAVSSEADAQRLAQTLQSKYPVLKPLTLHTQSVTSGSSTHVRVQFFGLSDRGAATKACTQLGKQACFPVGG